MTSQKPYHHGDLRSCLIREGLALIREKGLTSLSLRAVARAVGVSAGAPYHHFQNRAELLAGIAAEGFTMLYQVVKEAQKNADEGEELTLMGTAYTSFAVKNPEHFRAMFSPELSEPGAFPALEEKAYAVFDELARSVFRGQSEGSIPEGNPQKYILIAWAVAHGVSTLLIDGPLANSEKIDFDPTLMGAIVAETMQSVLQQARKADDAGL